MLPETPKPISHDYIPFISPTGADITGASDFDDLLKCRYKTIAVTNVTIKNFKLIAILSAVLTTRSSPVTSHLS